MENGSTVEIGLVGNEGFIGFHALLGSNISREQVIVQVAGDVNRIPTARLKEEFARGGLLQSLLMRYVQTLFIQVATNAACIQFHSIEERLARWLLTVSDRLTSVNFLLTQETMAHMIGVRRASITIAANTFKQEGILTYSRGNITILDRARLKACACECYHLINDEFDRILGNQEPGI